MSIQQTIQGKLEAELQPSFLSVENESHNHNVPANSETHFKVVVVSPRFADKRQVQRHQQIYQLLKEELAGPVHALALHTYAPDEWDSNSQVAASPDCLGGKKKES